MDVAALTRDLDGIRIEDNPAIVRQKSRDFFWYSPVLKRQLDHIVADLVVTPATEAEVARVLAAAWRHGVPVTPRGAGTGNYGQAMPLSGGIVLDLSRMNAVLEIGPGRVAAQAGAVLAAIDEATRAHSGQEIRLFPSTYRTATIGGFVGGGSGGVGSIRWGGLRNFGNVIGLRLLTCEAEPRAIDLTGEDVLKASHAYGTNGVITRVEAPLTAAYDWVDVLVGFDALDAAVGFSEDVANADGLLVKEVAPIAAPVPYDYFLRHQRFLRREQALVVVVVAPFALDALDVLVRRAKGEVVFRSDRIDRAEAAKLPPAYELTWNHTTLRALRVDPTITYLQVQYPDRAGVLRMAERFGDEVPIHCEMIRFDGRIAFTGLPLVRFTDEARLDEIIAIHEAEGCAVFNPHRYTLEEGGMKRSDPVQLAFKREADPKGLLNPGKMIAWENPDFDFEAGGTYLFPGLQAAE